VYRSARYSSIGLELGVSVIIGMAMGYWVDSKFDTDPFGLFVGMGLGFVAAFRSIRRTLKILEAEEKQESRERDRA
jgi:ATP synthase protein I